MGLEELKQEILNKAKNEAEIIIKSAESEAKNIINDAKTQIEEYKKIQYSESKKQTENMERLYTASANTAAKHILLEKKKEMVEEAFNAARKILVKQRKNKRYIEKLLKMAEKEVVINRIYSNKADLNEFENYEKKEIEIYGLIAENKEGTMKVDLSFDTILEDIKAKSLHEIAELLFNEN